MQWGLTGVVTIGITSGLKVAVNRKRPNGGKWSFPSGHTASAFMGASFLHYRYGWEYGFPAYAVAAVVGYSRVNANKHYWSDVVAAAAIANVTAYVFADALNDDVYIFPYSDLQKKNFGITLGIKF